MQGTPSHDVTAIAGEYDEEKGLRSGGRMAEIRAEHKVNGQCARFRTSLVKYFREKGAELPDADVAGYTSGRTKSNLGACIAVLRGEGAEEAYAYIGRADSMDDLVDELVIALEENGFDGIDIGVKAIGPIMPLMLAVLEVTYGISIPHALGSYRHLIDEGKNPYDFE